MNASPRCCRPETTRRSHPASTSSPTGASTSCRMSASSSATTPSSWSTPAWGRRTAGSLEAARRFRGDRTSS